MSESVIIIGASGFIGKALMKELKAANIEAFGFSRKDCDLLKQDEVVQKISSKLANSTLIYAAGKHRQYGDTLDFYTSNNVSVVNVLFAAEKNIPERIVFLSSMEVYGVIEKGQKITESSNLAPTSLYAAGKISQEYLIRTWAHLHKVPCTMLRLPGIYGTDDNHTSIISTLFAAGINELEFDLHTAGSELRDYITSADLASCIAKIITTESVPEVLNIGSGASVSINYIIDLVGRVLGKALKIHHRVPSLPGFDIVLDDALLRSTLDGFAFTSVEDGVKLYAKYLEKLEMLQDDFLSDIHF